MSRPSAAGEGNGNAVRERDPPLRIRLTSKKASFRWDRNLTPFLLLSLFPLLFLVKTGNEVCNRNL